MFPRACSGELYGALELDSQCTAAEITRQYRRLALRYHPDRNAGTTVAQFQRIEEAHRVLSDPQQRQLYDAVGRDGLKLFGDYSGGMVGRLVLAVGNVAASCLLMGIFSTAFFFSLLFGCYKIDAPSRWPSWAVILIPIWVFLPMLALASVSVMVASVRQKLYVLLLPSVRLLLCTVIAATTAAALDHRLSPVVAFIPWVIWYMLGTVSDVVMMVPTVYRRTHSPNFPEETATDSAAATSNSPQDPFSHGGLHHASTTAGDAAAGTTPSTSPMTAASYHHNSENSPPSENVSFITTPWRTRQYWRDLAEMILEAVCIYSFIALAFQRALQQQRKASADPVARPVLSFWVVFAPLFAFFGVHLLLNMWEGLYASSPDSTKNRGDSQEDQLHRHENLPSAGERVANMLIRSFPSACGLYMSAMWAAKVEYEFNGVTRGIDPSAFVAFLPILVVLGAPAFLVCCGGCLIVCLGGILMGTGNSEEVALQEQQVHPPAQRNGGHNLPNLIRGEDYRSIAARTPRIQGGHANAATTTTTTRRGNTAKDLTIEQID